MLPQMSLIMLADNRETSPPIFVVLKKNLNAPRPFSCFVPGMTYFCPSWKRPSPCFQYVPTTVVVLIRQPSQNIHTFCQRFRSPYVFWSSSSLLVDETAEVVLPSATSTEFDSNWVYSSLYLLSTVLLYTTYQVLFKEKCCCTPACTCRVLLLLLLFSS